MHLSRCRSFIVGHSRKRADKVILGGIVYLIVIVACFEYYSYNTAFSKQQTKSLEYKVQLRKTKEHGGEPVNSTQLQIREDDKKRTFEAANDSKSRIQTVHKVCTRLKEPNVLEQYADQKKTARQQRFNVLHHLIVNEEYKVLFCFIPKVGCSNMKRIFLVMDGLYPSVEKVETRNMNKEVTRLDNKKFNDVQREYILKNYYKFMIVRDPFERLVSAYRNKWQDKRNYELHATLGKQIIEKYRYNNTKEVKTGSDVRFNEYIRYLIDTPSEKLNEHWMPYEDLCRPCNVNYNFIGSIDTFTRDVRYVMRQIHANETKYYVMKAYRGALTKSKERTASFLKELPKKHFGKLLAAYKTDHELFDYPLPEYDKLDERYFLN